MNQTGGTTLTFEQRMSAVKDWLKEDILPRFGAPPNIDKARAAQDVAEAVNANIPSTQTMDQFKSHLEKIGKRVIQNAKSRILPVPKDFIDACREATKSAAPVTRTESKLCPYEITERRVRAGEAIGSTWLSELCMADLISKTSLTMKDLEPYIAAHKHTINGENNEQNGIHRW
jgi:predicted RNA-binding Zn ribbon-like protein